MTQEKHIDYNKTFIIHLIKCQCVLPQLLHKEKIIFHKFPVFSVIENDIVLQKIVQCTNCGILHKVHEIGQSTILNGKEDSPALLTIEDIKTSLPQNVISVMEAYNLDISRWEQAKFIFENKLYNQTVVLASEEIDGNIQGKLLKFQENNTIKIESFFQQSNIG